MELAPEELMDSIRTLVRIATKHNYTFSGVLLTAAETEFVPMLTVGNIQGMPLEELADLWRGYADLIDQLAGGGGQVFRQKISKPC